MRCRLNCRMPTKLSHEVPTKLSHEVPTKLSHEEETVARMRQFPPVRGGIPDCGSATDDALEERSQARKAPPKNAPADGAQPRVQTGARHAPNEHLETRSIKPEARR